MYWVTNEITGRKQPPVLPECNDSHSDLAERFRVHFSENIMNVRSIMCHHDAPLTTFAANQSTPQLHSVNIHTHNRRCYCSTREQITFKILRSRSLADDSVRNKLQYYCNSASEYHQYVIKICNCTIWNEACADHSHVQEDRFGLKLHQELPPYNTSQLCLKIVRDTCRGWPSTLHWRKQTPWPVPERVSSASQHRNSTRAYSRWHHADTRPKKGNETRPPRSYCRLWHSGPWHTIETNIIHPHLWIGVGVDIILLVGQNTRC